MRPLRVLWDFHAWASPQVSDPTWYDRAEKRITGPALFYHEEMGRVFLTEGTTMTMTYPLWFRWSESLKRWTAFNFPLEEIHNG